MLCSNCNVEIVDGAAYCTNCGTAMGLRCQSCQANNPPSSRYCYVCGTNLTHPDSRHSEPLSAPQEIHQSMGTRYGGFWVRLVGELIDTGILLIPGIPISLVALLMGDWFMDIYLNTLIGTIYFISFWALWGATPGKRLLGLHIERPDGSRMGPGRAVARYFASWLSLLLLGAGYIMIGLREDKRGLHDLICDTVVIHQKP